MIRNLNATGPNAREAAKAATTFQAAVESAALAILARYEAQGAGIGLNGRYKALSEGGRLAVTPSELENSLRDAGWKRFSIRDVEDVLNKAGFKYEYRSNKHFYSL